MMEDLFQIFLREWSLRSVQQAFYQLCVNRGVDPTDFANVYEKLKSEDRFLDKSSKQRQLWELLDRRRTQKVYQSQTACRGMNVFIVGSGPCGLRLAIECALLGCHVVVAEWRDKFSRNNVLHLWKFVIEDLKALGAKIFMPKFCTGSIEHISIRKLQFILLKVALVLGVQFYDGVKFEDLIEPQNGKGWRASFTPKDHILSEYEFDVVIGASAFKSVVVRGKLAIGITANFVNHHTKEEDSIPELQGVAYVYKQDFFEELYHKSNIKLENIVYYKGDTHYFVMCGNKHNLISKGIIKRDFDDAKLLLAKENVDYDMLCKYVTQVVDYATEGRLNNLEFAHNGHRQSDVACFDFTELSSADHSTRFIQFMGHPLVLSLVGDYLHEPFWPTGSGCARGFLSVLDTAWFLKRVAGKSEIVSEVLAEREGIYALLSQTQQNNLSTAYHKYTINPATRYMCFKQNRPSISDLMGSDELSKNELLSLVMDIKRQKADNAKFLRKCSLFRFCFMAAQSKGVRISSFGRGSWADGRALAALIVKFNEDFQPTVPLTDRSASSVLWNETLKFVEANLKIPNPTHSHGIWPIMEERHRIRYLENLVEILRADPYHVKLCMSPTLAKSYYEFRAMDCEKQARVLKPRQLANKEMRDLAASTAPQERNKLVETPIAAFCLTERRTSIDPLNPGLLYKLDKIVNSKIHNEAHKHPFPVTPLPVSEKHPSRLEDSLENGSLKGVFNVSEFRQKFETTQLEKRSGSKSSDSSSSNSEPDQHPVDPMNVRFGGVEYCSLTNGKVFRSSTQHQFSQSRTLASPLLEKSLGQRTPAVRSTAAHEQSKNAVYNSVSQRRLRLCALCKRDVYLAEQLLADGLAIHKQCFRCSFCERKLDIGAAFVDRTWEKDFGPRWYCKQHSRMEPSDKLCRLTSKQKANVAVVEPTNSSASYVSKVIVQSLSTETEPDEILAEPVSPPRPISSPPPPHQRKLHRGTSRASVSTRNRRRLSEFNSPTKLIEECRDRNAQRLASFENQNENIPNMVENVTTSALNENWINVEEENDGQFSNESFEEEADPAEELGEDDVFSDDGDLWFELKDYLEKSLDAAEQTASDLIDGFNRTHLRNHFEQKTPPKCRIRPSFREEEFFTARESRAETSGNDNYMESTCKDQFYTPVTHFGDPTVQNAKDVLGPPIDTMIDKQSATPRRRQLKIRKGPRRATVAIDLRRENLSKDDSVANLNIKQSAAGGILRTPSNQNRSRALHIKQTDQNLERVRNEIEMIRKRRQIEREHQLQQIQRRMGEVEVRTNEVVTVGSYLENSLLNNPYNTWELEQWISYVQQHEELVREAEILRLRLKEFRLDDEHRRLKAHPTEALLNSEIVKQVLAEKRAVSDELRELETDGIHKVTAAEQIKAKPSYRDYGPVFIQN